jgi:hypothetical protein
MQPEHIAVAAKQALAHKTKRLHQTKG